MLLFWAASRCLCILTSLQLHAAIRQRWSAQRESVIDWKSVTVLDATSAHTFRCCLISACDVLIKTLDVSRIIIILNAADRVRPNNDIWLPLTLPIQCSIVASCCDDWGTFAACMLCNGMPNSALFVVPESGTLPDPATVSALTVSVDCVTTAR